MSPMLSLTVNGRRVTTDVDDPRVLLVDFLRMRLASPAVTGAGPSVFRARDLEAALGRSFTAETARATTVSAAKLNGDLHASPEYRAHLIPVLAARAVDAAA